MDAKKASLPAAALALALGGFAVGQKVATPTPSARIVKLRVEADGRMTAVLLTRGVVREIGCAADGTSTSGGVPAGLVCKAAADFVKAAQPAAVEFAASLSESKQ